MIEGPKGKERGDSVCVCGGRGGGGRNRQDKDIQGWGCTEEREGCEISRHEHGL